MITTLTGSNSYLLTAELKRRIADFIAAYTDMGLEKVDGEDGDYSRISEAIQNLPFLAAKKLVVLRNPSANKEFTEKFDDLLNTIPETNDVLIYESKLDKRSSYAKLLQKKTDFQTFDEVREQELPNWLMAEAKVRGGEIGRREATLLINRLGTNQQLLNNELDKLLAYQPTITSETIELLTDPTPQSTIFQLLDEGFAGHVQKAMELYHDQRSQRVEPQAIIPMLAWQLQTIALVKAAGQKPVETIASETRLNPFVVRKSRSIAGRLTFNRLKELIHELRELDVSLKTTPIDADEALKLFLLHLAE